jgi:ligand-binding sensor protein
MFKVYWTMQGGTYGKEFTDMTEALNYCQYLRKSNGRFVTMCSEQSDMVGEFGVTEVDEGYDWKKRR